MSLSPVAHEFEAQNQLKMIEEELILALTNSFIQLTCEVELSLSTFTL